MLSINSVNKMVVRDFSVNWTESNNPDEKRFIFISENVTNMNETSKTSYLFHHLHSSETAQSLLYVLFVNKFHCLLFMMKSSGVY